MSDLADSMGVSGSGMKAQASRLRYVSENVANADTPGYRRKLAVLEQAASGLDTAQGTVTLGETQLDQSALPRVYSPGHPMADTNGYIEGSNVDLVVEIADAREAQRSYEANLKMFDQARQMSSSLLDILRK